MKISSLFALLIVLIPALLAPNIFAAKRPPIQPYQVWDTLKDNPRNIRKLKKLFDSISNNPEKLKELAEFDEPISTFMTKLASLKITKETADIFEKLLDATKNAPIKNLQDQIKSAISELDSMCNTNRPEDEKPSLWQRTIIALIRQVDEFNICEWSEASFINAALRFGNAQDLIKIIKSIAPEWYTGEMVSRLQEHWQRDIKDDDTGAQRKFFDIVMEFELERMKKLAKYPELLKREDMGVSIRDEVKRRIKNPLNNDDPKILQEILKKIDEKK